MQGDARYIASSWLDQARPIRSWLVSSVACAGLLLWACDPASDLGRFPHSFAASYCRFGYHCCTPADRRVFPPDGSFAQLARENQFSDEAGCTTTFETVLLSGQYSLIKASVKDNRMTWNQAAAQACLDAIGAASSACDARAFVKALSGPSSGVPAVCELSKLGVGTVGDGKACTQAEDCASAGARCEQEPPSVGAPAVRSVGVCTPLPGPGVPCSNYRCAPNAACTGGVCTAVAATGESCLAAPCNPDTDYCRKDTMTCASLIADGQRCDPFDQSQSCLSRNCARDVCAAPPWSLISTAYLVCTENPTGL